VKQYVSDIPFHAEEQHISKIETHEVKQHVSDAVYHAEEKHVNNTANGSLRNGTVHDVTQELKK
jgi:hypothetical protein